MIRRGGTSTVPSISPIAILPTKKLPRRLMEITRSKSAAGVCYWETVRVRPKARSSRFTETAILSMSGTSRE